MTSEPEEVKTWDEKFIQKRLQNRYSSSQNYFYSNLVRAITKFYPTHSTFVFADIECLLAEQEFLKVYHTQTEQIEKLMAFKEFYYYHEDCPRIFGDSHIAEKYEYWQQKKRDLVYKKLKMMYGESYSNDSGSQSTQKSVHKDHRQVNVSHLLMDISEFNPFSKKYYLRTQPKQKDKKNKIEEKGSVDMMKSLNKDLSFMLKRVSMDLSEITNLSSSAHSQALSHFDHSTFASQTNNGLMGQLQNVKMHKKQVRNDTRKNMNINYEKLNRYETTDSCSKIMEHADSKYPTKKDEPSIPNSYASKITKGTEKKHSATREEKIKSILFVSEMGQMNKNFCSKSHQITKKQSPNKAEPSKGIKANNMKNENLAKRNSVKELKLGIEIDPAEMKEYKNLILHFKHASEDKSKQRQISVKVSPTKLINRNSQIQPATVNLNEPKSKQGSINGLTFRSRQMSMKKIEWKGEEFNDNRMQNVLVRYRSQILSPPKKLFNLNSNHDNRVSIKLLATKTQRKDGKSETKTVSPKCHIKILNENESNKVKINFNVKSVGKKYVHAVM